MNSDDIKEKLETISNKYSLDLILKKNQNNGISVFGYFTRDILNPDQAKNIEEAIKEAIIIDNVIVLDLFNISGAEMMKISNDCEVLYQKNSDDFESFKTLAWKIWIEERDYLINPNQFDCWNILKKKIELNENYEEFFPQEGEVWMSSLGKNIGREQNGIGNYFSRPVLIIKKFNGEIFWVVPLSSKQKSLDFYYNFTDEGGEKVSIILAQLKLISVKRLNRRLYNLSNEHVRKIKTKLKDFIV